MWCRTRCTSRFQLCKNSAHPLFNNFELSFSMYLEHSWEYLLFATKQSVGRILQCFWSIRQQLMTRSCCCTLRW
jgi:hypothetical protein